MSPLAKHLWLGTAALLLCLPVMAADESGIVSAAQLPRATVNCPGLTSVPMTADELQALPLQLVATLPCGSEVTVLAEDEGYTARVRSNDRQEGYVARMYLLPVKTAPVLAAPAPPAEATVVNGVAHWQSGTPGCDQFRSQGRNVESITAKGITVQVSLQDTGWKLRAAVAISNKTDAALDVQPSLVKLNELEPNQRGLPVQDPRKIARAVNHQALWTTATAKPTPGAAGDSAAPQNSLNYSTSAPDDLSQHLVLSSTDHYTAHEYSDHPLALALTKMSLPPQQKIAGVIWFDRDASAREFSLSVPVGEVVFRFPLSF